LTRVELGRIAGPHGLRGEVKVRLHWKESDAFSECKAVDVGSTLRRYAIEWARPGTGGPILKLVGVDDRDSALALKGAELSVDQGELPPLAPGEYYLADLVGAVVIGPEGLIGEILEVRAHPSVDCAVIKLPDGRQCELPLTEHWLSEVDVAERRVVLSSTEGLI
jgi:16S rRNA processing protein RimM